MARYEADSVGFTERQFEGVQQRADKRTQRQIEGEKRLLGLKTLAKGVNALINQRADEFEANQIQVKTAYQNHINKAEQLKKLEEQINASGRTATDFFKNSYSAALKQEAEAEATALGQTFTKQN